MLQNRHAVKLRVFLVGCSRSGTTLLQVLIASHPRIHSFPETSFFINGIGVRCRPLAWIGLSPRARYAIENFLRRIQREDLLKYSDKTLQTHSHFRFVGIPCMSHSRKNVSKRFKLTVGKQNNWNHSSSCVTLTIFCHLLRKKSPSLEHKFFRKRVFTFQRFSRRTLAKRNFFSHRGSRLLRKIWSIVRVNHSSRMPWGVC